MRAAKHRLTGRTGVILTLLAALAAAFAPAPAHADPCARPADGLPTGPLQYAFFDGDIARPRRACPRTEVALGGGALAVLDTGNFYGTLGGGGALSGSWRFSDKGEAFASIEAVQFRFVQNATLKQTRIGPGFTSAGASYIAYGNELAAVALTGRLTLPTAFGLYENAWPFALDLGASLALGLPQEMLRDVLAFHAFAGATLGLALGGDLAAGASFSLAAGLEYTPWEWLGVVVDLTSGYGREAVLDYLGAAAGLRFRIGRGLGVELGAMLPLAGATRADFSGGLRVSWRFAE
jgi:hypothetical protein